MTGMTMPSPPAGWERVDAWLAETGRRPFPFQTAAWSAYLQGGSGLIHAATGVGKTLAAWLGPVIEGVDENDSDAPPLRVVWVTPLRALATDTTANLVQPARDLGLDWTVEMRTGDTPSTVRRRQSKRLPTALVTTPESLTLLLSYPDAEARFAGLRCLVVDEWHELMGTKRGVQTELALARLKRWRPGLRIWGLSATIGNTDIAMRALLGGSAPDGQVIRGGIERHVAIDAVIPETVDRFPWAGHLGLRLLPDVIRRIDAADSTLVFTNTRSQAETWYQAIVDECPPWSQAVALHHGSIDKAERVRVEERMRTGRLRAIVCTSSLDLGVDFSPVDQVIQIGSPKGIARLLQRAGRSGHRPGKASRILCVPTHALELVEIAAVREAARDGILEPRHPVSRPLDVLVQHLVTMALGGGFSADDLFAEVTTTHAYRALPREEFDWALDFVTTGGSTLSAYPEYRRVATVGRRYQVADATIARRHRMSIGTITSDAHIAVRFENGRRLGSVEEAFVAKLRRGDVFVFAGRLLEYRRLKESTVYVRRARRRSGRVPQWMGGRMPLSTELASAVREQLARFAVGRGGSDEIDAVAPLLELQARWSAVPGTDTLLIERLASREGRHLFVYPFEGRSVHEGLAALLAYRISRRTPMTISLAVNDYGFEMLSDAPFALEAALADGLLEEQRLVEDVSGCLNLSEMAGRRFREIARIAGLVFTGYPGRPKSGSQIQASSGLMYRVFQRYDADNRLLAQADREVLERQLEYRRMASALARMAASRRQVVDIPHPTPMAFPLMVSRLRAQISSEKLADRVRRMQVRLETAADRKR